MIQLTAVRRIVQCFQGLGCTLVLLLFLVPSLSSALGAPTKASVSQPASSPTRKLKIFPVPSPSSTPLLCPTVPSRTVALPPPPYDLERGDCALRGRSEGVEAYLQALEAIAAECHARRNAAWQIVQDAKGRLDAAIDSLSRNHQRSLSLPGKSSLFHPALSKAIPSLEQRDRSAADSFALEPLEPAPQMCSVLSTPSEPTGRSEPFPPDGFYYTLWLQHMTEHVLQYCRMIDELIKPIAQACSESNEEAQCILDDPAQGKITDAQKTAFHARLAGAMNAATLKNDYLNFFYEETLQHYGWGNFREYFRDEYIQCNETRQSGFSPALQTQLPLYMGIAGKGAKAREQWMQKLTRVNSTLQGILQKKRTGKPVKKLLK